MDKNVFSVLTEADKRLPLYVTSAGGWEHQEPMRREHGFADYQWIQTISGQGDLETEDGRRITVSKGQGMLLYPNERHAYSALRTPWEVVWLSWNGAQAEAMMASLQLTRTEVLHVSSPERTLLRCREAHAGAQSADPLRMLRVSAILYELLLDLAAYGSVAELRSKRQHAEQLAPVLELIEQRSAEPLTLDVLAGKLGVSPQHTCHLFQQTLGMRPFEYLKQCACAKRRNCCCRIGSSRCSKSASGSGTGMRAILSSCLSSRKG